MQDFRLHRGVVLLFALAASGLAVPPAGADDQADRLNEAVRMFEAGNYLDAQKMLTDLDRSKLSDQQQTLRDDFLNRTQVAITMSEKALRDLDDAETAIAELEMGEARQLLERVLENEYAAASLRSTATAHLRDMDSGVNVPQAVGGVESELIEIQAPNGNDAVAAPAISAADADQARVLTREADELVRTGRYDAARRLYDQALILVPGHPGAIDGLVALAGHEENESGSRGGSLIDEIRLQNQINWQRSVASYRDAEAIIRSHVRMARFDEAWQMLARARHIVEAGKQFAEPAARYESLRDEMRTLESFVRGQERADHERAVSRTREEIEKQRQTHGRQKEEKRARQVEALWRQARQHRSDGDLQAAINVLKQVNIIDPRNDPARWLMDELDDKLQYKVSRKLRDDYYSQTRQVLQDVEESKIPWSDELIYPDEWPELIRRPERRRQGETRQDALLWGSLDHPIGVDFHQLPFDRVIERLADAEHLNIIVNWHDLAMVKIKPDTPITLSLPNEITLKRALTEVLEQAGAGVVDLGFDVSEGILKIATQKKIDESVTTWVHDVTDLLMEIPYNTDSPMTDLRQANRMTGSPSPRRDERLWAVGDEEDEEPEEDNERRTRVRALMDMIMDQIAPKSWRDRGGSIGSMDEINGQLVITQNAASQRRVGNLLNKLREQRAIQIAIEARFVTVSSHYLEELGIDLDIVLNNGNAGFDFVPNGNVPATDPLLGSVLLLPRTFSRLGFTPSVPALGGVANTQNPVGGINQPTGQTVFIPRASSGGGSRLTPVPIINQVTSFTDPASFGSDIPGSFAGQTLGPAFNLFGSFLDNIQVDFLLRATQADSRTNVLTAPRLVLTNGQRSWIAVTIQQNFVSTLVPVVATGAVAQQPQIGTIDSGAVLDVVATVTSDKRYVTMNLRPGVTRLLDLQTIPFSGGGAGGGFGGGTALNAFIQIPTLSSQRIETTVTVPDGGTILIGGQKLASETEVEAGVPILSKIPILKRLYSSRSMIKDEQTLLILIKPKIFILSEQEELAFPSFAQG